MRIGLLTLLVDERSAAAAIAAVIDGPTYEANGSIYRSHPDDWFEPVGALKFAGNVPDEQTPPHKESQLKLKNVAQAVVEKITTAIAGPPEFSAEQIAEFRAAQLAAADMEPARKEIRELSRERVAAEAAVASGLAVFNGLVPRVARDRIDDQLKAAQARLSKATAAYDNLPGLCPSSELQRARRQWKERNIQLSELRSGVENRVDCARNELRQAEKNVATDPESRRAAEEVRHFARAVVSAKNDFEELTDELEVIKRELVQHGAARDALYAEMRRFEI